MAETLGRPITLAEALAEDRRRAEQQETLSPVPSESTTITESEKASTYAQEENEEQP